jgi:hypothetical protein
MLADATANTFRHLVLVNFNTSSSYPLAPPAPVPQRRDLICLFSRRGRRTGAKRSKATIRDVEQLGAATTGVAGHAKGFITPRLS